MATSVTIDFNAETARVEKQVGKLTKDITNFSRRTESSIKKASRSFRGLGASIAGVVSGAAFAAATKSSLDFADSVGKAAERTGFTVQALQELRFAGDQTGLSIGETDAALARFSKRLGLFRTTGGGAAAKVFQDLQINVNQLNTDVFRDVVDIIAQVDNDVDRLALTTQFFGDEAQKLALTLRGGNQGLSEFARQANELGLILEEDLVRNAEAANDQLSILGQVVRVQLTRSLVELAPEIIRTGESFAAAIPDILSFVSAIASGISKIGDFTRSLALIGETDLQLRGANAGLGELLDTTQNLSNVGFENLSSDFLAVDEFDDDINTILTQIEELDAVLERTRVRQQAALSAGDISQANTLGALADDAADRVRGLETELERINELRRSAAEERITQRAGGPSPEAEAAQEITGINKLLADLRNERTSKAVESNNKISESEKEVQRIIESTRTPLEEYIANVTRLESLRSQLGEDTFGRALAQEAERLAASSEAAREYADVQREIQGIIESVKTPVEEYIDAVTRLEELRPLLGEELFGRAIAQEAQGLVDSTGELIEEAETANEAFSSLGLTMASAFEDAIIGGGDFGDVLKGLEQDIIRIILRTTVTKPLGDALTGALTGAAGGGGAAGGIFGAIFSGLFRANGGPVTANNPFIVGERGPELFVPNSSGTIVPNGGASVVNNINITSPDGTLSQSSLSQLQARLGESINQSLLRNT